jgi:two-component system chemotaxis sensor kinase CheA
MAENDILLETFVYENSQLLEQLEDLLLSGEKHATLNREQIDETFRVMHTIKGSSAMMEYQGMASLAHAVEDLFSKIRIKNPDDSQWVRIFDIVLESIDFFKEEIVKIQEGNAPDGAANELCQELKEITLRLDADTGESGTDPEPVAEAAGIHMDISNSELARLQKNENDSYYYAKIRFYSDCQMETVRAFGVLVAIKDMYSDIIHYPQNLESNCDDDVAENGFTLLLTATKETAGLIREKLEQTMFLQSLEFNEIAMGDQKFERAETENGAEKMPKQAAAAASSSKTEDKEIKQSFLSVNINKIDKLMNLVGEIVTTESMVTKNPDLADLHLENFDKQARLLKKLTDELQDVVMSIRMVPISSVFHKMQRIVRDMGKKEHKNASLVILGEETEVDKNVLDNLSDPLMHLIRNAMDHGLETAEERLAAGKSEKGTIVLEARNSGGDVIVRVTDDGRGLNRAKIIRKAIEKGLTNKNESDITDKEAFGFILMPGFSTKEQVTEYSGRGVGMDVVRNNINNIGGSIVVESDEGKGTSIIMHIPLTLAILNGMKVSVGDSMYIVPILTIRESLEPKKHKIIVDPDGNEMMMIRGECFPVIRLHEIFNVDTGLKNLNEGIMVLVESEAGAACLFADKLLGEQQAVVKPMPAYITKNMGRLKGIAGCSILGDGSIARVLDVNSLLV